MQHIPPTFLICQGKINLIECNVSEKIIFLELVNKNIKRISMNKINIEKDDILVSG